jgi:hypothetical protein
MVGAGLSFRFLFTDGLVESEAWRVLASAEATTCLPMQPPGGAPVGYFDAEETKERRVKAKRKRREEAKKQKKARRGSRAASRRSSVASSAVTGTGAVSEEDGGSD